MEPSKYDIITTIPAQPGYYILTLIEEGENGEPCEFSRVPVIAWRIHSRSDNGFEYVNIQYPLGDEPAEETAILRPDGTVFDSNEQFENESAALRSYQEYHRASVKARSERNTG
jgi:hypothetical protein